MNVANAAASVADAEAVGVATMGAEAAGFETAAALRFVIAALLFGATFLELAFGIAAFFKAAAFLFFIAAFFKAAASFFFVPPFASSFLNFEIFAHSSGESAHPVLIPFVKSCNAVRADDSVSGGHDEMSRTCSWQLFFDGRSASP
jgi:hypothetical protein